MYTPHFLLDTSPGHRQPIYIKFSYCIAPWEVVFTFMVPAPRPAGRWNCCTMLDWHCRSQEGKPYTPSLYTMYAVTLPWSGIHGTVLMRRLFTTYHNIGVYYPDNDKLLRYNKNIIMATQKYIYDTKRFLKWYSLKELHYSNVMCIQKVLFPLNT